MELKPLFLAMEEDSMYFSLINISIKKGIWLNAFSKKLKIGDVLQHVMKKQLPCFRGWYTSLVFWYGYYFRDTP